MKKTKSLPHRERWLSVRQHIAKEKRSPEFREAFETRQLIIQIAMLVRGMREAAGLTQAELARRAGMKQSVIARLESAKAKAVPSLSTLSKISGATRIPLRLAPKGRRLSGVELAAG